MAKYTVELREIVKSGLKLFNFPYVLYDEAKKPEFEQRFIDHFFFREIGVETVGRFQHHLMNKCNEVLPFYNVMFETALYEYDVKNNYNLTETFTKSISNSKSLTENLNQNGTTNNLVTNANTINRDNDSTTTGNKTNTLESTSVHDEDGETKRVESIKETGKLDKTSTVDIDGKKVQSNTPNSLLSMTDIKNNVYASQADIEDTTNKTVDVQTNSADKNGTTTDTTKNDVTDNVNATSVDVSVDTSKDISKETSSGTSQNNGIISNNAITTQNTNDNGSESYTLERVGDIGVDTTPDKLRKHLEIQKVLQTVYTQFFEECEDLFMQVY